ncbi:hypothetical protein [Mucilaginibacter agri]|uniref:hypothetical protein n=1 Tax=Mucilaginibacter agri TaxID=2695265 RepID=UPI001AA0F9FE|nr:hypothetical protein [Mucilaginibacter agri]
MSQRSNLLILIVEVVLLAVNILALFNDASFVITRKVAQAQILRVERVKSPNPYKVTLRYDNQYLNATVISYVDDIDRSYGEGLQKVKTTVDVYYGRYFPGEIYLADYKHPNARFLLLYPIFMLVIGIAIYYQISARRALKQQVV